MNQHRDKLFSDLHRLIDSQKFETQEELQKFLDGLMGNQIPHLDPETLTPKQQAQDLVYEAVELPPVKAKANIEKALRLDADCIEAYEYLGGRQSTLEIAMPFYEKGISIGRRLFGGEFLEENKGFFWGIHETRPFMRCLQQYSDCLLALGKMKESAAILEELIELNPNDNQGVRDQLLLYLMLMDEDEKFLKYAAMFKDDAMAFALFNRALFAFKTKGEGREANSKLKKALQQNRFVSKKLFSNKPITSLPPFYGWGDENEATYYAYFAKPVWQTIPGALDWLKKAGKPLQCPHKSSNS